MIRKNVVELLQKAFKDVDRTNLHLRLKTMSPNRPALILSGELEISATTAMLIEEVTGLDAMELLTTQALDHLLQVGYQPKK